MFPDDLSEQVATELRQQQHRIVFAESCTAGLISASLGRISGVSEVLAGSAVVYQVDTKVEWLNVSPAVVRQCGVVSEEVSREMAVGVLRNTPHATISASITGHLGPQAPVELDGMAWTCVCCRFGDKVRSTTRKLVLQTEDESQENDLQIRRIRQFEAVRQVMKFTLQCLETPSRFFLP